MDLQKMGSFLKELRKNRGLTQEQLAEKMYVSNRTVSRWETGSNMPDIQILIKLAEFYDVELIEILNGERKSEIMNEEVKATSLKVSEYEQKMKEKSMKFFRVLFILAIVGKIVSRFLGDMQEGRPEAFVNATDFTIGFFDGASVGLLILGVLFTYGVFDKLNRKKANFFKEKGIIK